jgi:hypothetical protein
MSKSRLSVFLSLMFVFLSGTTLGALGYRWYTVSTQSGEKGPGPRGPHDPSEVKKHIMAEMTDAVKLDAAQVQKLSEILDTTRARFEEVHGEMNAKGKEIWQAQIDQVNAILRDDQRPLYQQLRDKHEREREARKKQHQRGIQQDTSKK